MENARIINISKDKCSGCGACFNACPVDAINMTEDREGFLYPTIDETKCTECGLCNKVCSAQNNIRKNETAPKCYAGWAEDQDLRLKSSSGGIFTLLANNVLSQNGYVCGAAFDETFKVVHTFISDSNELGKLRGSKYVQSEMGSVLQETRDLLNSGKTVLFSGTPCQVAGLYGYLQKDYPNLLTVDIFCHGVPSPGVFRDYLKEELGENAQIENISFKNKEKGWKLPQFDLRYNSEGRQKYMLQISFENIYNLGFFKDLYIRPACHSCDFAKLPRPADISIGDFWQIEHYDKKLDDNKGTSLIIPNNAKGTMLLEKIKPFMAVCEETPLEVAKKGNRTLYRPNSPHPNRQAFFDDYQHSGVINNIKDKLGKIDTVGIMNFHVSYLNYGALMVSYSMSVIISKLGYRPENINFVRPVVLQFLKTNPFYDFRNKYLNLSEECYDRKDLEKLNGNYSKLVTGSDQVFRSGWHNDFKFYFNWAKGRKTLISYAASFGKTTFDGKKSEIKAIRKLLQRFDAISVREKSGIDICETVMHTRAKQVIDPTLLLDAEDYQHIIDNEKSDWPHEDYIGYMFLNSTNIEKLEKLSLASDYKVVSSTHDENGEFRSFGDWLNCIKNARYFITDSFHGTCFSIIFKKDFIVIDNPFSGSERTNNLFRTLGIHLNRMHDDLESICEASFSEKIDYATVYQNLQQERDDSLAFLKESLAMRPIHKPEFKFPLSYYTNLVKETIREKIPRKQ